HPGYIPDTFQGLDVQRIAWAHVDVDIYQSVLDCIDFIYPRLVPGGYMIFDDYGFPSCVSARRAVDEEFADKPEVPLCLPTGQCMVVRLAH
ncbi:MAG: TylF/MycF/NovP-related O-methyltransferase, partial [Candidatus Dormiibacterota bacterium]